jgi:hypothetical protein
MSANSVVQLGRLEPVDLRKAWPDEAANFTPWLSEQANLSELADTLGLSLELDSVEKPVGPFAADILARDTNTNGWVLIENQIASTDHKHLGQLLTYAAGLDAHTVIWIAAEFRDEHLAAVEFLNRATAEGFSFFAVQIELYRIGTSPYAPRFSVLAKPNGWRKQVQAGVEGILTETQKSYLEYWSSLIAKAATRYPALAKRNPWRQSWQNLETLRPGDPRAALYAAFSWDQGLRLDLSLHGSLAKAAFDKFESHKEQIQKSFGGGPLEWDRSPKTQVSRIACYMNGKERVEDRDHWPAQHEWLLTWAPKLGSAVKPFLPELEQLREPETAEVDA